ncbi:phosphoribosyl-ATP diphosphatase [Desulfofarcimen acetoxidans DSM 771]|uniref:Histidine biosynthesis bifunctional protein HisIE n=1 Tax=Desulfofarcimen acetoxidans (strain ATCC 49208 / DSM 771 / KCTC 5769 / VKM B-1644 / 5575) TaxID=485916 RepID=C8W204_DESAS|nr:bifunctional phosphoribosyl-AMP cyclohydrolase/phosphoribosyl-ATP diphosphatase HisIE [Desulfofarcimen acetoxidans]ACV61668.1 phosphoribosyl-ATP diphosphatase [Desulfofarcimen acetoxidans DSM 771]
MQQLDITKLKYDRSGLIPAIVQDYATREVLMVAYMNQEAVEKTLTTLETWFWSRSRQKFWHKGESSGNVQKVREIYHDCDKDTLLVLVDQKGAACHEGYYSCFHYRINRDCTVEIVGEQQFDPDEVYGKISENKEQAKETVPTAGAGVLDELYGVILDRKEKMPEGAYTSYLFDKGLDKILKKVGEESAEVILAAKNKDKHELVKESADLLYHLLVMLAEQGVMPGEVFAELKQRRK